MTNQRSAPLLREIWRRLTVGLWLKAFGIPGFIAVFFLGYFLILNSPLFEVTTMPSTWLDRCIPYFPGAWVLYVSLWFYVQIPPLLVDSRRELFLYGAVAALVSLVGFAFFVFWPTAVPVVAVDDQGTLAGIRGLDTTGNSCPSLHVAFSVFTAVWIEEQLRRSARFGWLRWVNFVWCLGIVYSTLGTKQHVFLDVLPGALLGMAGGWLDSFLSRRIRVAVTDNALPGLSQISPAARKL
ncbi:MAG: phosphatase PAP2 family protein [Nibricoccus sp.]